MAGLIATDKDTKSLIFPQPEKNIDGSLTGRAVQASDYFQSHRFAIQDTGNYIQSTFAAGFSACSVPEQNIDHLEYSEGSWTYSKFFPGRSTFTTVTLTKGIVIGTSKFASWILACAEGSNYRTDIRIYHIHRSDTGANSSPTMNTITLNPSRAIVCKNCMPIRFRPGHDFDAMGSEISVEEIEFQPEYFYIETPAAT